MKTFGPYFLIDSIGSGGMAEVFVAAPLDKTKRDSVPPLVAVKRIRAEYAAHKPFVERFISEAKLGALLNHKNITRIHDLGVAGTDVYFAMDWVDGRSLDVFYRKLKESQIRLSDKHVFYIFCQLADGLAAAISATDSVGRPLGIVHRDLTPGNVLLGFDGSVKLTDFGIATAASLVRQGNATAVMGKTAYMSPEQLQSKPLDHRSDIFSFGVLLFEALTGTRPFDGSSQIEVQRKILEEKPDLSALNEKKYPGIYAFIRQALSKSPASRPTSPSALKEVLPAGDVEFDQAALSDLMTSLFEDEYASKKAKIKKGLEARDQMSQGGTNLDEDEDFVQDLLSAPAQTGTGERTEFLPSQSSQKTTVRRKDKEITSPSLGRIELRKKLVKKESGQSDVVEEVVFPKPPESLPDELDQLLPDTPAPSNPWVPPEELPAPSDDSELDPRMTMRSLMDPQKAEKETSLGKRRSSETPAKFEAHYGTLLSQPDAFISEPAIPIGRKSRRFRLPAIPSAVMTTALLVVIAVAIVVALSKLTTKSVPKTMEPVQTVRLWISLEGANDTGWESRSSRNRKWIQPLNEFFKREYIQVTGDPSAPFEVVAEDPKQHASMVDWKDSFFSSGPFGEFESLFRVSLKSSAINNATVFVHGYPKTFKEIAKYPLDLVAKRPLRAGIVFVPLNDREADESLVRIAHEVLHSLGATDKYDTRGRPSFPDGFAAPNQSPLYPQRYGEIMSRAVLLAEDNHRPLRSLSEARIGEATAREIGWK
jgi:serine/threonine protein kinase